MHRVTLPDGTRVEDRWVKWLRVFAYLLIALAGIFLLISPFITEIYTKTAEVMAWFLIVGGALSCFGATTERWWGEYMGTPLLMSALSVFAFISFAGTFDVAPFIALGNTCLLAAVVLGLASRWRHSRVVYLLAVHLSDHDEYPPLDQERGQRDA
jgi:hypothetical protein